MKNITTKLCLFSLTFFVSFTLLFGIKAKAQSDDDLYQTHRAAVAYFEQYEYQKALPLFQKLKKMRPDDPLFTLKLGICHLNNYDPQKGLYYLLQAKELDPEVNFDYYYWLGRAYQLDFQFSKALKTYRKVLELAPKKSKTRELTLDNINSIHNGKVFFKQNSPYLVKNLGSTMNSAFIEHSPIITKDGKKIIFTSRRPLTANEKPNKDGQYFEKIFIATLRNDSIVEEVHSINSDFKLTPEEHYATIQLLDDDTKLVLYKSGKFYQSEYKDGKWQQPEKLDKNLKPGTLKTDVFFDRERNLIFYVDNSKRNAADMDLYFLKQDENGNWDKVALPEYINSTSDDRAPVLINDTTFIFASKGRNSIGGFDLFKSTFNYEKNTFTEPVNLGAPINSTYDDIYYYPFPNCNKAVVSSARPHNYGNGDIFLISPAPLQKVEGAVTDVEGNVLTEAMVTFVDKENIANESKIFTDSVTGTYSTKLIVNRPYIAFVVQNGDTLEVKQGLKLVVPSEAIATQEEFIEHNIIVGNKAPAVATVNTEEQILELDEVAIAEATAPTNNSQTAMAQATAGKTPKEAESQDETEDADEETFIENDAAEDNEMAMETTANQPKNAQSTSSNSGTSESSKANNSSQKPAGDTGKTTTGTTSSKAATSGQTKTAVAKPGEIAVAMPGKIIYFDYNQKEVGPAGKVALDFIALKLKNNPGATLMLSGHTDSMGNYDYNQKLSEQRAASAKAYLTSIGIKADRIKTNGFGQTKPVASNSYEQNGRELNRRVEVTPQTNLDFSKVIIKTDINSLKQIIKPVYFAYNHKRLSPMAKATLDVLVTVLDKLETINIQVEGHTDASGQAAYNMQLSKSRAESVKNYLVSNGISAKRINVSWKGENEATGTDPAQNRKAEIIISE